MCIEMLKQEKKNLLLIGTNTIISGWRFNIK